MYIIYKHTNIITQLSYIGYTKQGLLIRWKLHLKASLKHEWKFSKILRKYPNENQWIHEILIDEILTVKEAKEKEIEMIAKYDTFNSGYNMNTGGSGKKGYKLSEETKRKISQKVKLAMSCPEVREKISKGLKEYYKIHPGIMTGKKHTSETIEKIRRSALNMSEETKKKIGEGSSRTWKNPETRIKRLQYLQNMSEETRKKMSDAKKGKTTWNKGKKWAPEIIEKMRNAKLGKVISEKTRKKMRLSALNKNAKQYTFIDPNGNKVDVFNLTKFSQEHKLHQGLMSAVALGKRGHHKGYTRYVEVI
jgi:hypothetical protein